MAGYGRGWAAISGIAQGIESGLMTAERFRYEQAEIDKMQQQMAISAFLQQQAKDADERKRKAQANFAKYESGEAGANVQPPPADAILPQPAMPGQSSLPSPTMLSQFGLQSGPPPAMQMPPSSIQVPPGGGGAPAPAGMPPRPQGFTPSRAAPPSLGGQPQGAPAPAGGAVTPPPMPAAPSPPPTALKSPQAMFEWGMKQGMKPEEIYDMVAEGMPIIDKQNKAILDGLREQVLVEKGKAEVERAIRERLQAENVGKEKPTAKQKDALFAAGGDEAKARDLVRKQVEKAGTWKGGASAASGPLGKPLPTATVDYYALQSLAGDNSWQTGLARGKEGQKLIAAVKERIPQLAAELNITPEEAIANKGALTAKMKALGQRQLFVSAGNQYVRNMQSQADLVDKYMAKGAAGGVPVLNKWIQAGRKAVAGDPDVTALDTAIRGLAREHQRIVTGVTSNAQLHVAAQATADELLNKDMAPEQMRATMKVMREEADNAIKAGQDEISALKSDIGKRHSGGESGSEAPAGKVREFKTEAEAAAAHLPSGTKVKINGVSGTWQ